MIRKGSEVINFGQCLSSVLYSCENMPGGVQFLIDKNLKELSPIIKEIEEKRAEIISERSLFDEDGNPKLETDENGRKKYTYKSDEDMQDAIDKVNMLMEVQYDVEVYKIPLSLYSNVQIQTKNVVGQDILFDIYIDETK